MLVDIELEDTDRDIRFAAEVSFGYRAQTPGDRVTPGEGAEVDIRRVRLASATVKIGDDWHKVSMPSRVMTSTEIEAYRSQIEELVLEEVLSGVAS